MAKAKPSASAPESDAASASTDPVLSTTETDAAAKPDATAPTASPSATAADLRPNDIDILSQVIQIVCTAKLKRDLISLRERVAEFLGLPVTYPNHRK